MKRINKKIKRFWGVSEVGFSVMSMMETSFLLFFLTDVAKLPLDMAAFITSTAAIADAICAVPSGIVIDKLSFRSGKYRPWLLICPPVVTLLFVLCFTRIGSDTLTCAIIITAYVLSHFIWTIAWNANRSLISVLTEDPQEKNFLSGRIAVGTSLGKILASFLIPFLSVQIGKRISGVASYTVICAISCVLFVICYYVHYAITKGYDTDTSSGGRAVTFRDMLRSVTGNGNLIAILAHDAIRLVAFFGIAASAAYYAKIVIGDAGALIGPGRELFRLCRGKIGGERRLGSGLRGLRTAAWRLLFFRRQSGGDRNTALPCPVQFWHCLRTDFQAVFHVRYLQ